MPKKNPIIIIRKNAFSWLHTYLNTNVIHIIKHNTFLRNFNTKYLLDFPEKTLFGISKLDLDLEELIDDLRSAENYE